MQDDKKVKGVSDRELRNLIKTAMKETLEDYLADPAWDRPIKPEIEKRLQKLLERARGE